MRRAADTSRDAQGGYVLVAVLSVMLLVAGLLAGAMAFMRSTLHGARIGDQEVAAAGVLRGGLELTAYQLFVIKADPRAVNRRAVRFAGATVAPTLVDEASKADLNGSDPKLLLALFQGIGMDSGPAIDLVNRIVAMRPPKQENGQGPGGSPAVGGTTPTQAPQALNAQQAGAGQGVSGQPGAPPQQQQKRPRGFQSIDQLRDLAELPAAAMKAITPMLTVYNPDGKINIMTANADVLSLIPGLNRPKIEQIMTLRASDDKKAIAAMDTILGDAKNFTKTEPGPAFTAHVEALGPFRKRTVDAVIAASKSPNEPYYVLDWRE